jgi:hypothetical protein
MSAPDLPIIEKLLTERFLGTDRHGASIVDDRNPDGPEAAEVIKELYAALERLLACSPPSRATHHAEEVLSRARGEEVGNG